MKNLTMLCIAFLLIGLSACNSQTQQSTNQESIAETIDAENFERLFIEKGGQLLDVRTEYEYQNQNHLKNAVNINIDGNNFGEEALNSLDKNKPVFVYCAAGGRSKLAMDSLNKMGFTEIYNLKGGITNWKAAGKAVE